MTLCRMLLARTDDVSPERLPRLCCCCFTFMHSQCDDFVWISPVRWPELCLCVPGDRKRKVENDIPHSNVFFVCFLYVSSGVYLKVREKKVACFEWHVTRAKLEEFVSNTRFVWPIHRREQSATRAVIANERHRILFNELLNIIRIYWWL